MIFLVVLWIAGGASRADVLGQVVTRAAAWAVAIAMILFLPRPKFRTERPIALLLAGAVVLVALQLVPLPPAVWQSLPGRDLLGQSFAIAGAEGQWAPISISPEATLNALGSLIVPAVVLALMALLPVSAFRPLAALVLALIAASCVVGLFQFSGALFDHPFLNDVVGEVSGSFANRNHFALFAAIGCLLAPVYAFSIKRSSLFAFPMALAFVGLCVMVILAIGSRAGLVLAVVAVPLGLLTVRSDVAGWMRRFPSRWRVIGMAAVSALVVGIVALAITLDRAATIARISDEGTEAGLRGMIRPTLYEMIEVYFPFGTGFGTFDPAYRIFEPTSLLSIEYVNLAHNDLLQVPLDGGLLAAALLVAAIAWWLFASLRAWRADRAPYAKAGSGILLLVLVASAMDYPARTPMVMAITIIAAVWLAAAVRKNPMSAASDRVYPT